MSGPEISDDSQAFQGGIAVSEHGWQGFPSLSNDLGCRAGFLWRRLHRGGSVPYAIPGRFVWMEWTRHRAGLCTYSMQEPGQFWASVNLPGPSHIRIPKLHSLVGYAHGMDLSLATRRWPCTAPCHWEATDTSRKDRPHLGSSALGVTSLGRVFSFFF